MQRTFVGELAGKTNEQISEQLFREVTLQFGLDKSKLLKAIGILRERETAYGKVNDLEDAIDEGRARGEFEDEVDDLEGVDSEEHMELESQIEYDESGSGMFTKNPELTLFIPAVNAKVNPEVDAKVNPEVDAKVKKKTKLARENLDIPGSAYKPWFNSTSLGGNEKVKIRLPLKVLYRKGKKGARKIYVMVEDERGKVGFVNSANLTTQEGILNDTKSSETRMVADVVDKCTLWLGAQITRTAAGRLKELVGKLDNSGELFVGYEKLKTFKKALEIRIVGSYAAVDQVMQSQGAQGPATEQYLKLKTALKLAHDPLLPYFAILPPSVNDWAPQQKSQLEDIGRNALKDIGKNALADQKLVGPAVKEKAEALLKEGLKVIPTAEKMVDDWLQRIGENPLATAKGIREQVDAGVGEKAKKVVEETITAASPEQSMGMLGKAIDFAVPTPGDHTSLAVTLKMPVQGIPPGIWYLEIGVKGQAYRGTKGAVNAAPDQPLGYDQNWLEVRGDFTVEAGAQGFGCRAGVNLGAFLRAGAKTTPQVMKALSYGLYRFWTPKASLLARFWAGGVGSAEKTLLNEAWAAMVEEQVFKDDPAAFVDLGLSAGVKGKLQGGPFKLAGGASASVFRRWNQALIKDALGQESLERPIQTFEEARQRRKRAGALRYQSGQSQGKSIPRIKVLSAEGEVEGTGIGSSKTIWTKVWGKPTWQFVHTGTVDIPLTTSIEDIRASIWKGCSGILIPTKNYLQEMAKKEESGEKQRSGTTAKDLGGAVDYTKALSTLSSGENHLDGLGGKVKKAVHELPLGSTGKEASASMIKDRLDFKPKVEIKLVVGEATGKSFCTLEAKMLRDLNLSLPGVGSVKWQTGKRLFAVDLENEKWFQELRDFATAPFLDQK